MTSIYWHRLCRLHEHWDENCLRSSPVAVFVFSPSRGQNCVEWFESCLQLLSTLPPSTESGISPVREKSERCSGMVSAWGRESLQSIQRPYDFFLSF